MTQKFRKGDIVTVEAVVESQYGDEPSYPTLAHKVTVKVAGGEKLMLKPEQLTLITPFFAPGERVKKKGRVMITGTVVANHEGFVWVKFDHGKPGTVPATELEPLEEVGLHVVAA
ncbi:hypothetical protein ACCS91_33715 [Rhizobium ruizarguesonis]